MADLLLKKASGELWKDSSGKILKSRPINETLLPQGLIGEFDADNVENVGGYCKTMYNQVSGGANAIQNTTSYQPNIELNAQNFKTAIVFPNTNYYLQLTLLNVRDFIVVMKYSGDTDYIFCNSDMSNSADGLGEGTFTWNNTTIRDGYLNSPVVVNGKVFPWPGTSRLNYSIASPYYVGSRTWNIYNIRHWRRFSSNSVAKMLAICFYNRILSIEEKLYNMQVYGQRYNIAMEA